MSAGITESSANTPNPEGDSPLSMPMQNTPYSPIGTATPLKAKPYYPPSPYSHAQSVGEDTGEGISNQADYSAEEGATDAMGTEDGAYAFGGMVRRSSRKNRMSSRKKTNRSFDGVAIKGKTKGRFV